MIDELMSDLVILGVFLLVGFGLRELIKPLQKAFIPASILGGFIALIVGDQVLGLVVIPESFQDIPGVLIALVMTGLLFGVTINVKQARAYTDYSLVSLAVIGLQIALGVGLGILLSWIWDGLPEGWGLMGVFAFFGGHGTAGAAGSMFESLGVEGNLEIGMILATIGMVVGIVLGMVIVNIGVRRGWTQFVTDPASAPAWSLGGRIPEEKRRVLGYERVTPANLNTIALQLSWLLLAMFVGGWLFQALEAIWPAASEIPMMVHGMIGALIVWPLMNLLGIAHYVDKPTINNISGFSLELIILAAIATLSIDVAVQFAGPILLFSVVMIAATTLVSLYYFWKFSRDSWFEKAMMSWGTDTGNTSVGLALLRAVDPDNRSNGAEAHGVFSGITFWVNFFPVLLPMLLVQYIGIPIAIGLALFIIPIALGYLLLRKQRPRVALPVGAKNNI